MISGNEIMEAQKLTDDEFKEFAGFIQKESGIFLKDAKVTLLSNRLRKRVKELSFASFSDYFDYLVSRKDPGEIERMINAVSTNETYFFRNAKHFDVLIEHIIPEMYRKLRRPLQILSAGCSTGEEAYTIVMMLHEKNMSEKAALYGVDINRDVVDAAKKGIYDFRKLRVTPNEYSLKYFHKSENGMYSLDRRIVKSVEFSRMNLKKDDLRKIYDIIFCRNVMIYFDRDDQKTVVEKFYKSMNPGGYLFIGHSESLYFLQSPFQYEKIMDTPLYHKPGK